MAQLKADPELLRTRAVQYSGEAEKVNDVITALTRIVKQELPAEWEGEIYQAFDRQYDAIKPSFDKMLELVNGIAAQSRQLAQEYSDFDSGLAGQINY